MHVALAEARPVAEFDAQLVACPAWRAGNRVRRCPALVEDPDRRNRRFADTTVPISGDSISVTAQVPLKTLRRTWRRPSTRRCRHRRWQCWRCGWASRPCSGSFELTAAPRFSIDARCSGNAAARAPMSAASEARAARRFSSGAISASGSKLRGCRPWPNSTASQPSRPQCSSSPMVSRPLSTNNSRRRANVSGSGIARQRCQKGESSRREAW